MYPPSAFRLLAVVLGFAGLAACTMVTPPPRVQVAEGVLVGASRAGIHEFRGIPYAAAPVGSRRWQPPAPAAPWTGSRSARRHGPACAQPVNTLVRLPPAGISEDCLTLNVLAPPAPSAPLPVMVWIHGGGYLQGTGNDPVLNGPALPRAGVVLVTINYRLNVFGFLAHPALATSDAGPGNYGLLDAVAALRWVQRNIAAFGGDPTRVTVFGESAGADVINHLMVMPAAAGLFHRAISQSSSVGLAPAAWLDRDTPLQLSGHATARRYVARWGPGDDPVAAAARLRALPADELVAAIGDRGRFTPVVDGRVLPGQPGLLFAAGRQHRVPYLTGSNSWEASLGRSIGGGFDPARAARLVPAADQARLYPELAGAQRDDAIFGDLVIAAPSAWLAGRMAATGAPVYRYYLSYLPTARRGLQPGVAHADDIPFVFGTLDRVPDRGALSATDRARSQLLVDYWAAFAASGDPNGGGPAGAGPGSPNPGAEGSGGGGRPAWPRATGRHGPVLEIGDDVALRAAFLPARLDFHVTRGKALLERVR